MLLPEERYWGNSFIRRRMTAWDWLSNREISWQSKSPFP